MDEGSSRRAVLAAARVLAFGGLAGPAMSAGLTPALPQPALTSRYAFRLTVLIGVPQELGMANGVRKRVIPIIGGTVEGPRLAGEVLPGGADWQTILADGTADILARYTVKVSDGTLISVTNPGFRHGPAAVLADIAAGKTVDPALYYFRTTPRFDVASDSVHSWLGKTVFVCTAARFSERVVLDIFEIQ